MIDSSPTYARYFLDGIKPPNERRLGLELELIGYYERDLRRIGRDMVQKLMAWFAGRGGHAHCEDSAIISVSAEWGGITLEPGGQIEFSGRPKLRIAEIEADLKRFLVLLAEFAEDEDLLFIACGFDPLRTRNEQCWVVKRRYAIMRPFLAARGECGLDMMTRTAAIQVSLDYTSTSDFIKFYVLGNRLGPFIAAMFANSPYAGGRCSAYKSTRYSIWLRTDPRRCGIGSAAFCAGLTLDQFVESILAIPTLFVHREGAMVPTDGKLLAEISDGRSEDFTDLLSTVFTDARARTYIEMRSADAGQITNALALMAFWKGLTYDAVAAEQAMALIPDLDRAEYCRLSEAVAIDGLEANECGVSVLATVRDLLDLSRDGLRRLAPDELAYLEELQHRIDKGLAPADLLLKRHADDVVAAMQSLRVV